MDSKTKNLWILICVLLISGCSKAKQDVIADNGFDQICRYYTQVFTDKKYKTLSVDEKYEIIAKKIQGSVTDVDAIEAYVADAQVDPKDKYRLFKKAAEYSLKRSWDCPLLKKMNDKIVKEQNRNNKRREIGVQNRK